jgi:two-component system sensor histidine kinase AlgZ
LTDKIEEDFFLPNLCEPQSILFLVLVTELLVFVVVMANSVFINFSWIDLGLTSLFVQWVVLLSAALVCALRPYLMNIATPIATIVCYLLILSLTLVFSIFVEWFFLVEDIDWAAEQTGRVIRNLMISAVMTGIAFRYFFLQHHLRQQEQAELNSRIQALQSRIRPHFLFNSMNIIASLISIDPELAEEVVEDLSVLFRASLNDSSDRPVLLQDEIDLCEKYVHIESLRLDDRLAVEWGIHVDTASSRIPLLTIQPLLENAIYHGIQPLPQGGVVTVDITQKNDMLTVVVTNPVAHENHSHERGNKMALDNTRRRLEAIYGQRASVKSSQDHLIYTATVQYPLTEEG